MAWRTMNVNDAVRVRLTGKGRSILNRNGLSDRLLPGRSNEEKDGWSKWQLWDLMSVFGFNVYNGCTMPFETTIEVEVVEGRNDEPDRVEEA